ncbi:hypothetical protein OF83DRAFT_1088271 [Amylostereum chailletii]|nr:hypothetical protein OF83DRAFT_1088271 [Amylostereum chailletii]
MHINVTFEEQKPTNAKKKRSNHSTEVRSRSSLMSRNYEGSSRGCTLEGFVLLFGVERWCPAVQWRRSARSMRSFRVFEFGVNRTRVATLANQPNHLTRLLCATQFPPHHLPDTLSDAFHVHYVILVDLDLTACLEGLAVRHAKGEAHVDVEAPRRAQSTGLRINEEVAYLFVGVMNLGILILGIWIKG